MRPTALLCALLAAGCASPVVQPVSGDRAAGVVRVEVTRPMAVSYAWRDFDWSEADAQAVEACKRWGFSSADGFGVRCRERALVGGRCMDQVLVREYQCVD